MAKSNNRAAKGLKPEAALERWSDPIEWADMHQYEDARERKSTASGRSPYELRNKEYWKRREPLEEALLEKLRSGELVGSYLSDSREDGRFFLHKEQWRVLWIEYDCDQAAGGGDVFDELEIAEAAAPPENVDRIPAWLQRQISNADETGQAEPFDGILLDADFRHIYLNGQLIEFGVTQANVMKALSAVAGTDDQLR